MARTSDEEAIFDHIVETLSKYPSSWELLEASARAGDTNCQRVLAERLLMKIKRELPE
jgi:hypothetical protein